MIPFHILRPHIGEMIIDQLIIDDDDDDPLYVVKAFRAVLSLPLEELLPYSDKVLCGLFKTICDINRNTFLDSIANSVE